MHVFVSRAAFKIVELRVDFVSDFLKHHFPGVPFAVRLGLLLPGITALQFLLGHLRFLRFLLDVDLAVLTVIAGDTRAGIASDSDSEAEGVGEAVGGDNLASDSDSEAEGADNLSSDSDSEAEKYAGDDMNLIYAGPVNASKQPHGAGSKCRHVTFTSTDPRGPRYLEADEITDCEWSNGTLVSGKGRYEQYEGQFIKYEGQFICGQFSGYGVNTGYDGNSYRGFWCDGDEDGPGAEYDKDGQFERGGMWSNGGLNEGNTTADEETAIQAIKDMQKELGE